MSTIGRKLGTVLMDIVETIVIAFSIFILIWFLLYQPHEIRGASMDGIAGFHTGQYILTDLITYRFRSPRRGEVIVFEYPLDRSLDYIKRIIALPNERIMLKDNHIYIYNEKNELGFILDESDYLSTNVTTSPREFLNENEVVRVPEDSYFVMGDNREFSSDSRTFGFIKKNDIVGRSFLRYWPPNEFGLISSPDFNN